MKKVLVFTYGGHLPPYDRPLKARLSQRITKAYDCVMNELADPYTVAFAAGKQPANKLHRKPLRLNMQEELHAIAAKKEGWRPNVDIVLLESPLARIKDETAALIQYIHRNSFDECIVVVSLRDAAKVSWHMTRHESHTKISYVLAWNPTLSAFFNLFRSNSKGLPERTVTIG